MALRVLQPVERRRRRRGRGRRLLLAAILAAAAAAFALWRLDVTFTHTHSAGPTPASAVRAPSRKPGGRGPLAEQPPVKPLTLLVGSPALRGRRLSPALR